METPKIKTIPELVKELRNVSDDINMGVKIRWGQETTLMDEAATKLESLHTSLVTAVEGMRAENKLIGTDEEQYLIDAEEEYVYAYNKALDDTLTIINSIFKE